MFQKMLSKTRRALSFISLHAVVLVGLSTTSASISNSFLAVLNSTDGRALCAVGQPRSVFTLDGDTQISNQNPSCIPDPVRCSWMCRKDPNCTSFNHRSDSRRCEFFTGRPNLCSEQDQCALFRDEARRAAFSTASEDDLEENCLFPFTYNGGIFYQCMLDGINLPGNCYQKICMAVNRTWIPCSPTQDIPLLSTPEFFNNTELNVSMMIMTFGAINGWMFIHQKLSLNTGMLFYKSWNDYKEGFGSIYGNYWMGLERLHLITGTGNFVLRVEMTSSSNGNWYSAEYWNFYVDGESLKYRIHFGSYSGDNGDSFRYGDLRNLNGMPFTTYDQDNDLNVADNCANLHQGAWWYQNCAKGELNADSSFYQWLTMADMKLASIPTLEISRMMIKSV